MKTIGLLGGMSWESTATYYRLINEGVNSALGGLHSAKLLLSSVDFAEVEAAQRSGEWDQVGNLLADAARRLETAGADLLLIGTNTMHKVADQIQAAITIPLLHIAEATADAVQNAGLSTVALLGTKYTMLEPFYRDVLNAAGLTVLIPDEADQEIVNRVIFDELCHGQVRPESKAAYLRIAAELAAQGAEGIILGCTEIGLLISQSDTDWPVFDTTQIHAAAAVRAALA